MKKDLINNVQISSPLDGFSTHELKEFPFKAILSFKYLIEFWEKEAESENKTRALIAKSVLAEAAKFPELKEPLPFDINLDKYKDVIDLLLQVIYPASQWNNAISGSYFPFQFKCFYSTPKFQRVLSPDGSMNLSLLNHSGQVMLYGKTLNAYAFILNTYYKQKIFIETPVIAKIFDSVSGSNIYYKLIIDPNFVRPVPVGNLPEVSEKDIEKILNDPMNLKQWMKIIPPDKFEFHGFVTYTAINVNTQEILSSLKNDLLEKEAIISSERFQSLEDKLKSLFNIPKLRLGLAALPKDWNTYKSYGKKIGDSFIMNESCSVNCADIEYSIYARAHNEGKPLIIDDIEKIENKNDVERALLAQGIRNILVAPLYYKSELIGVLELGSPNPGDINPLNAIKIKEILSLFAIAVKRSTEEIEGEIQSIIKEKCTAIHPSVEWRFRKAAINLIDKKRSGKPAEMEPIVFENVYPLYALSDIRDSSDNRNKAIQADLSEHLNIVKNILKNASSVKPLPIFSEMIFRINNYLKSIKDFLNSGDEVSIIDFIQNEIHPVFNHISSYNSGIREMIINYKTKLNPEIHTYYSRRKDYEESVSVINKIIADYLDESEIEAQKMFPHYFEKYKTDGVEHSIYIGASLTEERKFDLIYLKNLRLWQFITMCGVVKRTEEIKNKLKIPLETSHLILVQDNPLSIRFRQDEKKFDVDGTYNIRYEIMKKRIDKAVIRGKEERLTQPGKIAVIYSQQKEANEYKKYINYLINQGYLLNGIENYDLDDLQGVHGLRALRVSVNISSSSFKEKLKTDDITTMVNQLINIKSD